MSLAVFFTVARPLPLVLVKCSSRPEPPWVRTCISPTMPAQAAPILSRNGETFFRGFTHHESFHTRTDVQMQVELHHADHANGGRTWHVGSLLIRKTATAYLLRFKASEAREPGVEALRRGVAQVRIS